MWRCDPREDSIRFSVKILKMIGWQGVNSLRVGSQLLQFCWWDIYSMPVTSGASCSGRGRRTTSWSQTREWTHPSVVNFWSVAFNHQVSGARNSSGSLELFGSTSDTEAHLITYWSAIHCEYKAAKNLLEPSLKSSRDARLEAADSETTDNQR